MCFVLSGWKTIESDDDRERLKLVVPRILRGAVMWNFHDAVTAGHLGVRRTYDKITRSNYYWPHLRRYVQDYISSCDICEERKNPTRKKRSYMKTHVSGVKFERIGVDIAGPFPKSTNGYVYILVLSDYFTKFMEIFPLRNIEAQTVAETMFRGWIKRYGCPQEIHSDQGAQFESQLFLEMCKFLQINKTRTTSYHPQSDGMVERLNRTIKDMLSKYISVNQTDWDRFIDGIVFAYNSTIHETTGITPYRMVFGEEMTLPVNLITENLDSEEELIFGSEAGYVRNLEKCLCEMYQIVRSVTNQNSARQKRVYDRNVRSISYEVGDLVRRSQPKVAVGCKTKLARKWTGPWLVVKRLSDVLFQIKHSETSKPIVVHSDNIKPYRGNKQYSPTRDAEYTGDQLQRDRRSQVSRRRPQPLKTPPVGPPVPDARHQSSATNQSDFESEGRPEEETPQSSPTQTTRHGRIIRRPLRFRDYNAI